MHRLTATLAADGPIAQTDRRMLSSRLKSWTLVVPIKQGVGRKSRLAPMLDETARHAFADRMARHVVTVIGAVPTARVLVLSRARPDWWTGDWRDDGGTELNDAIDAARSTVGGNLFAVVHADLPLLSPLDIAELLAGAERDGVAIAPDRHGTGTNAIAIADGRPYRFAFGVGSFARHRAQGGAVVRRDGFAIDVDTPDDLARFRAATGGGSG